MIHVITNVTYTQAYGAWFCIHVASIAFLIGRGIKGSGPRIEICTPLRWFRYSPGYGEASRKAPAAAVVVAQPVAAVKVCR